MAQYTKMIWIAANDNDGGLTYGYNPEAINEIKQYQKREGKWKIRLRLLRLFWIALRRIEETKDQ